MAHVVITGANRGIGLALVRAYLAAGDRVVAGCRAPETADGLRALASDRLQVAALDVGDGASVERFAGGLDAPVDILINNAGVFGGRHQSLSDMDYAAWADAFNVMAMGPFRMVTALLPRFAADARIMSVSTQMSSSTWRHGGTYIYNSAKAAGNRVMQILAVDLEKRGIAVGYIHPGHVRTDMGGADAPVSPEDSAAGIRAVTAGLTLANTGRFWSWEGGELPL